MIDWFERLRATFLDFGAMGDVLPAMIGTA